MKLSGKLLLAFVPVFLLLIGDSYYLTNEQQEEAMLEQAKSAAIQKAQIVREALVQQMVEKYKIEDSFLERLQRVGGLKDLYVRIKVDNLKLMEDIIQDDPSRNSRLMAREQFAVAKGQTGNEVFTDGIARFVNRESEEALEAIVPFKAEKKCRSCHEVEINHVLGVAHIQIPLTDIKQAISKNSRFNALVSGGFAVVMLVIGYLLYRSLIQKPIKSLVAATEAIGQGNLNYEMKTSPSNDELGVLMQSFDKMRKALKQSQEALRTSTVGQIAQSLIRDFRAPMRQILLATDRMDRGDVDPATQKQLAATTRESVATMSKMAQDLLDFTTGEMRVNKMSCNVPIVVKYVSDAVRSELEKDMVKLEVEQKYSGNAPLDYERISRALINIINYSVNYIPPGGFIKLTTSSEGNNLLFTISDNGNGIPSAYQDKVFEPFVKVAAERGLGLSLALAKRIIEIQGGKIRLESEEGKGTTFTITMPLA
jgi:signal transduction histidine kinase